MRLALTGTICCVLATACALAGETPLAFARKPAVTKEGAGCKVEFAVAAPTDCAVCVLDSSGKVVRHLAAGVLGDKAPAPLKPGLAQQLIWDGKDDLGKPAAGGPFKVRVGLGLELKPEKVHGGPALVDPCALAVGAGGELFALGRIGHLHGGDGTAVCRVYDRQGKYLRTVMPRPGELPAEKTAGFGQLEVAGQGKIPFVHNAESRSLYPDLREPSRCVAAATRSGRFIFADANTGAGSVDGGGGELMLMSVEKDGGCPAQGFLGPKLPGGAFSCPALALSPDDKTVYVTGLATGNEYRKTLVPLHAVFKAETGAGPDGKAAPFVGEPDKAGADDRHFNDPRGVAVDGEGNVYVSDCGNNRIVAFKPDGAVLGQVKVDKPDMLAVHPRTGVIYVLTGELSNKLVRVSGIRDGRVTDGPTFKAGAGMKKYRRCRPVLALDAEADPPAIWVATDDAYYSGWTLKRIEDAGGAFANERDAFDKGGAEPLYFFDISLDRKRDVLWIRDGGAHPKTCTAIDGRTGERKSVGIPFPPRSSTSGAVLAWGRDDRFYIETAGNTASGKGIYRYGQDLKPLDFADGVKFVPTVGSIHLLSRGLDVNARGDGVSVRETDEAGSRKMNHVMLFGADGKVRKDRLVPGLFAGDCSARIDDAGNVYVATCARPDGEVVPPEFRGQLPPDRKLPGGGVNWYPAVCGSIVKFPPEGGAFRAGDRPVVTGYGAKSSLSGALWIRSGISAVPLHGSGGVGGAYYCSCEQIRFDVDGFGRVFAPDAVRFQAAVMDTGGNLIGRFGTYGNCDSQLAGGAALRFAWPLYVSASDEAVYVGDIVNRSVLRAAIVYGADETCAVP